MADASAESLPQSVVVHDITIYKLTLSETARVLPLLKGIPQLFGALQLSAEDPDKAAAVALPAILEYVPEALKILSIASRLSTDELDKKLDLGDAVDCFLAVFQVNDFLSVGKRLTDAFSTLKAA